MVAEITGLFAREEKWAAQTIMHLFLMHLFFSARNIAINKKKNPVQYGGGGGGGGGSISWRGWGA